MLRRVEIRRRSTDAFDDNNKGKISLENLKYIQITCTEDMYEVANEVASLNPPPAYEEHHRHFLKSINLQYTYMFELTLYCEDGDISRIETCKNIDEASIREMELAIAATPT